MMFIRDSLLSLVALAATVSAEQVGCFSNPGSLASQGHYTFQSAAYCMQLCTRAQKTVFGLTKGSECWCGDKVPPDTDKVDEKECNLACTGYLLSTCGGDNTFDIGTVSAALVFTGTETATSITETPSATTIAGGIIVDGGETASKFIPSATATLASSSSSMAASSRAVSPTVPTSSTPTTSSPSTSAHTGGASTMQVKAGSALVAGLLACALSL